MSDRTASRRLVTVVFCDLVGSTALSVDADPESVRPVVTRYFESLREVVERHGGAVEKFIGDAVMAVFGVPVTHEDDALRAVRAAWEMTAATGAIDTGAFPPLRCRVGVNTGEVFAGELATQESIVTGTAVNLAARLETAAAPDEILIGEATHRLVRDAVRCELVPALQLKGFDEPIDAYRLLQIEAGASGRTHRRDHAMIDRERELSMLGDVLERASAGRRCQLFTMLGAAGVGKSRLVEEFVHGARARTLRGRCLPYGDGITFWPVAEMVADAAGLSGDEDRAEAHARISALVSGPRAAVAAARVADAVGVGGEPAAPEETLWAIRTLFESIARTGPLILVFDDVHWAEPTLLELIEHVVTWSRDAPIVLLCLARPELLEAHPTWGGGTFNATSVLLDPLSDVDSVSLIETLLGRTELDPVAQELIVQAAGGNPLFVEELLATLIDDGTLVRDGGRWVATRDVAELSIPPSITALLTARLDRLPDDERIVVEHASVVGKVFSEPAVRALVPFELGTSLEGALGSLTRKELIHATTPGGMHRFRHQLIRDAAYHAMPKRRRAELHQAYAGWLASRPDGGPDEIVGYHLEQARRFIVEIGGDRALADELAGRAGDRLGTAGKRAFARGDARASTRLLTRAVRLLPERAEERPELLERLAESQLVIGEMEAAAATLDALGGVVAQGTPLGAWADLRRDEMAFLAEPRATSLVELKVRAGKVAADLEGADDRGHLASVLAFLALLAWLSGSAEEMVAMADRALALGRAAGNRGTLAVAAGYVGRGLQLGPTPCEDVLVRLTELMEVLDEDQVAHAACGLERATTLAMLGSTDEAVADLDASRATLEELGQRRWLAQATGVAGLIHWAAGDAEAAEADLRAGYTFFHGQGDLANATPAACGLAHVLADLGRFEEVAQLSDQVARTAGEYDLEPQIGWRTARARAAAHRGDHGTAERLVEEAVDLASGTDFLSIQGGTHLYRAEVRYAAGRVEDARAALETALERYERKGGRAEHAAARRLAEGWERAAGRGPVRP